MSKAITDLEHCPSCGAVLADVGFAANVAGPLTGVYCVPCTVTAYILRTAELIEPLGVDLIALLEKVPTNVEDN